MTSSIALLALAMVGGAIIANNLLGAEATKLSNLKAKSLALSKEQVNFDKAKQDIKKYSELQKITQAIVPEDKNQAAAVREIVNIAAANKISLSAITFPASTLGNTAGNKSATTPVPAANSKTAGLSQLQPVKNIPGVYELLITVQGDSARPVEYDKFISFLQALERNRRTAQVSTVTLQPDSENRKLLTFTLTLKEYIKP